MSETPITEEITPYLVREWFYDRRIVAITLKDMSRESLDRWAKESAQALIDLPADRPFLNLQDFTNVNFFTVTPYLSAKSREITALRPEISGRTAIVISGKSLFGRILSGFVNSLARSRRHRERRIFTSRDEAMDWLKAIMKE